jgi:hypothetical protein
MPTSTLGSGRDVRRRDYDLVRLGRNSHIGVDAIVNASKFPYGGAGYTVLFAT